jgi:hypothetical protein
MCSSAGPVLVGSDEADEDALSAKDCIAKVIEASKGALTEDDLEEVFDEIAKRAERRRRENPLEPRDQALAAIAKEMADEDALADMIEQRNRAINVLKSSAIFAHVDSMPGKEALAIDSLNVGSERGFDGAGLSVEAIQAGIKDGLQGPMLADLRKAGLLDILRKRDRDFERDLANEIARVTDESHGRDTGNKAAQEAAQIMAKTSEAARQTLNRRGAFIKKLPGWIARQTHDVVAITSAGFERWRDAILPRLDERTFDGVKDRDAFLHHAWQGITNGIHGSGTQGEWLGGFKGYSNRAKKASAERVLHFKSADDWYAYNEEFGAKSVLEAVSSGIESTARSAALMDVWGTNPEAMFNHVLDTVKRRKGISQKQVEALNSRWLKANFEAVNGTANSGGNPKWARWMANTRAWITMSKLGGVTLSAFPDIAVQASSLRHNGVSYFDGLANGFTSLMRGKGSAAQREVADYVNAGTQGIIGSVFERFGVNEAAGGKMTRAMRTFFKLNLLEWWTDAMKTGVGLILSKNLASYQAKGFADLPPLLQLNLRRYRLGEPEWNLLRTVDTKLAEGERYLTADAVDMIPDNAIKAWSKAEKAGSVKRARDDLKTRLNTYYANEIRTAMTEPGARERVISTWGTAAGTLPGEAIRYLMQFKTFGITFATRHIAREFLRSGQLDKTGLFALIVGTTSLGYVSMMAKEAAKGRMPREPEDASDAAKLFGAAMAQGGGLGIYGDFLFGEYNRFGGGLTGTLGGPGVGTVEDLARLYSDTKDWAKGDKKKAPAAEAFNLVKDNTPFLNLFWARTALDHMILFKVQEAMNPGYLKRMESRVKQDNNQSFWLAPTSAAR